MKILHSVLVFFIGILLYSCQKEESSIVLNTSTTLIRNSTLVNKVCRVAQHPTAIDNVIDNTSCYSVNLPVSLYANYQYLVLNSASDYSLVSSIFNQSDDDTDSISFVYPITITYSNFNQVLIHNLQELISITNACTPETNFNEIGCINFNYPIVLNTYQTDNQTLNATTLQNDTQLYHFLENLSDNQLLTFVYPLSMIKSNGQTIVINNNTELENAIDSAIQECNIPSTTSLSNCLVTGSWYISYFLDESHDETYAYNGYNFIFYANGTVSAIKNHVTSSGNWSVSNASGTTKLNLVFSSYTLDELQKNWTVLEFNNTNIRLKYQNTSQSQSHYLYFSKN